MDRIKTFFKLNRKTGNPRQSQFMDESSQVVPSVVQAIFDRPELGQWYPPVLVGPTTVGALATSLNCLRQAIQIVERLEPDDYVRYLLAYYNAGIERFGEYWHYADIVTVLLASVILIKPVNYLEIGVRRAAVWRWWRQKAQ